MIANRKLIYMNLPLFHKLSFRIAFFIVTLFSIAIGFYAYIFITNETDQEKEEILSGGRTFAELSTPLFYQDYLTSSSRGFPTFEDLAEDRMKHNTDITQVSLIALNGKIIFDSSDFNTGAPIGRTERSTDRFVTDNETRQMIQKSTLSILTRTSNGSEEAEIIVPIIESGGSHLFSMRYVLSFRSLEMRMTEIYRQTLLVFIPFILFTAAAGILLAYSITHPILRLISATQELTKQNFTIRVPENTQDEIGILAKAFNQAATNLEEARKKIEGYNKTLETQVTDRTRELQKKVEELEDLNKLMIGRELKMTELKEEIEKLRQTK